jgi:hypothetical protein
MNARQKAKYYRRKYEELANMPLRKLTVTNHKVDSLKFQKSYPEDLISMSKENEIKNMVTRDLVDGLVSQMDKYVTVKTWFEPCLNHHIFAGEVKVVRTKGEATP